MQPSSWPFGLCFCRFRSTNLVRTSLICASRAFSMAITYSVSFIANERTFPSHLVLLFVYVAVALQARLGLGFAAQSLSHTHTLNSRLRCSVMRFAKNFFSRIGSIDESEIYLASLSFSSFSYLSSIRAWEIWKSVTEFCRNRIFKVERVRWETLTFLILVWRWRATGGLSW